MPRRGQQSSKDFPHRTDGCCRFCGNPVPAGRFSWCSNACVVEYRRRTDWNLIRRTVLARDRYRCVLCGACDPDHGPLLEVDHIVELADGGAFHDLANLRTLCIPCHKSKTREARRARRAKMKEQALEAIHAALSG